MLNTYNKNPAHRRTPLELPVEPRARQIGQVVLRLAVLLPLLLILAPQIAWGQASSSSVLVLRVNRDGRYHAGLTRILNDFIEQTGTKTVHAAGLRSEDRRCDDPTCLTDIAESNKASVILAATIDRHGTKERLIRVWLYDVRTGHDRHAKDACDEVDLEERLKSLAGRLVSSLNAPEEAPSPPPPPPPEPPTAAVSTPPLALPQAKEQAPAIRPSSGPIPVAEPGQPVGKEKWRRSAWRTGLGAGLGVLTALSLGTAITLTVFNGQMTSGTCYPADGLTPRCQAGYMPLLTAGYAVSGAALVGSILTLSIR